MKILIVGSGSAGARHFEFARKIFSQSQIRVLSFHQTPNFVKNDLIDLQSAIDYKADLIVIANAAVDHLDVYQQLVGPDQLCVMEKPLTSELEKLRIFTELHGSYPQNVMIAYQLRFSQSLLAFKTAIDTKKVGKIHFVNMQVGQFLPDWRGVTDYRIGVSARSELGGGVLNELSHEIDVLHWIFGKPTVIFSNFEKKSTLEIDVEDFAEVVSIHTDQEKVQSWTLHLQIDMIRRDPIRRYEVVGPNGTLVWDGILGETSFYDGVTGHWLGLSKDTSSPHALFWEEVQKFVFSRQHNGATFEESISTLEFIQEIKMAGTQHSKGKK